MISTSEASERFRMYIFVMVIILENFTYNMRERGSESLCIFVSQELTYVTSNVRFICQYTLFFEQHKTPQKKFRNLSLIKNCSLISIIIDACLVSSERMLNSL